MSIENNYKTMLIKKVIVALAMIVFSCMLIFICKEASTKYTNNIITRDGFFFDTYISLCIYDSEDNYSSQITSKEDIEKLLDSCIDMCKDFENIFSITLENSELYRINNNPDFVNGIDIQISETLAECLGETIDISMVFGSKYSVLSGSLCDLWDYNNAVIPDDEDIVSNCISINAYKLTVNGNRIKLAFDVGEFKNVAKNYGYTTSGEDTNILMPNPRINLGASAKGYIADRLCTYLKDNGIKDAIIDLGGNIVVIGNKYDNTMYKIGIKKPFSTENESYAVCKVADKAIVTSGIYERYFEKNGTIYHHIIDCSTGYPVNNDILSVTIIAEESLLADCYSTGCLLLGKDNALSLINDTKEVECVIIDKNYNIHLSDGLTYEDSCIVLK